MGIPLCAREPGTLPDERYRARVPAVKATCVDVGAVGDLEAPERRLQPHDILVREAIFSGSIVGEKLLLRTTLASSPHILAVPAH